MIGRPTRSDAQVPPPWWKPISIASNSPLDFLADHLLSIPSSPFLFSDRKPRRRPISNCGWPPFCCGDRRC
jgi:hypothetical protein